jgi:hypothetical protein
MGLFLGWLSLIALGFQYSQEPSFGLDGLVIYGFVLDLT